MKIKKEIIFILLGILLLGGIIFVTYIFTNKNTTNTSNTSSKTINDVNINGDTTDVTLTDSYTITKEGIYNLTGTISNGLIIVNTDDNVNIILNNVTITNSGPCILVESAKNVYITIKGENTLTSTNLTDEYDSTIYSKDDLIFDGEGKITINSNLDGISSKDDLVINSANYIINSDDDSIKGKDSVTIEGGNITINTKGDGIKSTNEEDTEKGIITINNATINITSVKDGFDSANKLIMNNGNIKIKSSDDGMHADGYLEINDGNIEIDAVEGLEATYVKINGGIISITASDDGINASNKSTNYDVTIEINGGNITINMGQGDTDGIDSNGNLYINGGTINITGQSPFDYDGEAKYTSGTMIVNGEETTTITNQFMGGGMGGRPGDMGNNPNPPERR